MLACPDCRWERQQRTAKTHDTDTVRTRDGTGQGRTGPDRAGRKEQEEQRQGWSDWIVTMYCVWQRSLVRWRSTIGNGGWGRREQAACIAGWVLRHSRADITFGHPSTHSPITHPPAHPPPTPHPFQGLWSSSLRPWALIVHLPVFIVRGSLLCRRNIQRHRTCRRTVVASFLLPLPLAPPPFWHRDAMLCCVLCRATWRR